MEFTFAIQLVAYQTVVDRPVVGLFEADPLVVGLFEVYLMVVGSYSY